MNLHNLIKTIIVITIISFFCLYFTTMGGYYEYNLKQKNTLTEEAIKRFEQDVASGKEIIASNYIEEPKNYNNKVSNTALKLSNTISEIFDKIIKFFFKQIENTVNS